MRACNGIELVRGMRLREITGISDRTNSRTFSKVLRKCVRSTWLCGISVLWWR
ncbi:Uncharacterized protein APZ42_018435 [Daphnia magna]|uniref:Uncharacterized protein n=1 Tax=Daphnia magna TaxID=35525 RepID=A0A164Z708_9CRUS|nr:Uncharacterized protein APZ42_018435 [Daphnia magna]